MKKSKFIAIFAAAIVVLLAVGCFIFFQFYTIANGNIYRKDVEALDFSGQSLEKLPDLKDFPQLAYLDLRNTGLTVDDYERLQSAYPECEISWLLPFQDRYLSLDTEELTVSTICEDDIQLLSYLPVLRSVDATGCSDYDALLFLKAQYPQIDVRYHVLIGNQQIPNDTQMLTNANVEQIRFALQYLPDLKTVDARGCTDFVSLLQLVQEHPDCYFQYNVPFCGTFWPENTEEINIKATRLSDLEEVLPYLPKVTRVTIADPIADPDNIKGFLASHPEIQLSCNLTVLGKNVPYDTTLLDISGMQLDSMESLESILHLLPNLEKVDMCGCGYSDEEMAALNQRHPDTLFVWEVQIAYFKVRTDVTYFMPYQYGFVYTDDVVDKLKYLTELICIDMGHADISRSDFLAYMPKLQFLLMCDTDITDISYCANMKDLKYVELFMTKVTDFSPLLECKNLVDLNVSYTNPSDPMIFTQMTWLENFWYRGYWGTLNNDAIVKAMPNTRVVTGQGSSTALGWRKLPNYYAQRDILGMPYTHED